MTKSETCNFKFQLPELLKLTGMLTIMLLKIVLKLNIDKYFYTGCIFFFKIAFSI